MALRLYFQVFLVIVLMTACKEKDDSFQWEKIAKSKHLKSVFSDKDKYELQVQFTQINRDKENTPELISHSFNIDTSLYFYPASTVKMPVAFLALQRLNEIQSKGVELTKYTTIQHDRIRIPQTSALKDSTSKSGYPTIAHYINKIFVVSDNDAYNRLYEFCGQDYINKSLRQKGIFTNSRIVTRVGISGFNLKDNRYTNQVRFSNSENKTILLQEEKYSHKNYLKHLSKPFKGKGYYDEELDSIVMKPFNMYEKNFINILDLESSLQHIIFPNIFPSSQQFDLKKEDYQFLYQAMSKYPKDYEYLQNDADKNYDGYVKFFMYGDSKESIPDHIHIYNKVGFAYGYLTDAAYIFDTKNNVEFFLTATLLVNENQIFNDGIYEYNEIGIPFLANLGREIYNFELHRKKEFKADFSRFLQLDNNSL